MYRFINKIYFFFESLNCRNDQISSFPFNLPVKFWNWWKSESLYRNFVIAIFRMKLDKLKNMLRKILFNSTVTRKTKNDRWLLMVCSRNTTNIPSLFSRLHLIFYNLNMYVLNSVNRLSTDIKLKCCMKL